MCSNPAGVLSASHHGVSEGPNAWPSAPARCQSPENVEVFVNEHEDASARGTCGDLGP